MDDILNTYIYEIKKGTKPLALISVCNEKLEKCLDKISKNALSFAVQKIEGKANIFFGSEDCIRVVSLFIDKKVSDLSAEEDFNLGIMLGYNRIEQCKRYMNNKILQPVG